MSVRTMRTRARSQAYITAIDLAGEGLLWPLMAGAVLFGLIVAIVFWAAIWSFIVLVLQIIFGVALALGFFAILLTALTDL
jgi:hypothetical protein